MMPKFIGLLTAMMPFVCCHATVAGLDVYPKLGNVAETVSVPEFVPV